MAVLSPVCAGKPVHRAWANMAHAHQTDVEETGLEWLLKASLAHIRAKKIAKNIVQENAELRLALQELADEFALFAEACAHEAPSLEEIDRARALIAKTLSRMNG